MNIQIKVLIPFLVVCCRKGSSMMHDERRVRTLLLSLAWVQVLVNLDHGLRSKVQVNHHYHPKQEEPAINNIAIVSKYELHDGIDHI